MGMLLFSMENGYLDAILRGHRSGLLSSAQYSNLTQCETLDDLKVQLTGTDYADYLRNEPSPLNTTNLAAKLLAKFVDDFRYLRSNASTQLARFLDYITYGYMIDNVILLISGTLHGYDQDELLEKCHPLGIFDAMPALIVSTTISEIYNTVLVETPLAPYFRGCLSADDLDELHIEIIRNSLHKAYLEDFYSFCSTSMDAVTAETMKNILYFEADRRILNISINSFGTDLGKDDRFRLFPRIGTLYESGTAAKLARADDLNQIRGILDAYHDYRSLLDSTNATSDGRSLEERFFEREINLCKSAFDFQFCFTPFFAFVKMREQEIRNIIWIAECVKQKQKQNIHHYIPIF